MGRVEKILRHVDAFQQRHAPLAFIYGVVKKFGDDNGSNLCILLTYSVFTTIFPLLLLLVTVLGVVLSDNASLRHDVLTSTFSQFPVVGSALASNIHVLKSNSAFGLVIGIVGLIYGSTSLASTGLWVMNEAWSIPSTQRPSYVTRLLRSLVFLAVLGCGLFVTTVVESFGTLGHHGFILTILADLVALAINVGIYLLAFRVLTAKSVSTKSLVPGAIVAGVAWTILQGLGGFVVGHYLKDDSEIYGTFGTVLGLIAWIYLGTEITVYSVELNAVLHRKLWPRSIKSPPLTAADQEAISLVALTRQRKPQQQIISRIWGRATTQTDYLRGDTHEEDSIVGLERRVDATVTRIQSPSEGHGDHPHTNRSTPQQDSLA